MYLEQAITRIKHIDWDRVGTVVSIEDANLGVTFLQRLADFYQETSIKPRPPFVSDIARWMGDNGEMEFDQYYHDKTKKFLSKTIYQSKIIEYYLKLSQLADNRPEVGKYICVYEPMIEIFEHGGSFKLRVHDLEIENVSFIPLYHWFDTFKSEKR